MVSHPFLSSIDQAEDYPVGVNNTNWYAGYDLFARSDNDQEVTVVYNAFISNNTGEVNFWQL
jgi:hypothetical protein